MKSGSLKGLLALAAVLAVAAMVAADPTLTGSSANCIPATRGAANTPGAAARTSPNPGATTRAHLKAAYAQLPLSFEHNVGQTNSQVKFLSRGAGYTLFLTGTESVLELQGRRGGTSRARGTRGSRSGRDRFFSPSPPLRVSPSVVRATLLNPSRLSTPTAEDPLPGKSNYFIGNNPRKWHTDVPHYGKVRFRNVYPGVDLVYYGNQGQLEYDFVVAPGADPRRIGLQLTGARARTAPDGDLVLQTGAGNVIWRRPVAYQVSDGRHVPVACEYSLTGFGQSWRPPAASRSLAAVQAVRFQAGAYDRSKPLVIDPVLSYSTYLGGSEDTAAGAQAYGYGDFGEGIAVDSSGCAYVTGYTYATDFPTANALQAANGVAAAAQPGYTAFVSKLSQDGSSLVYSTYLGGSGRLIRDGAQEGDKADAIAVDSSGSAYVTGLTASSDFPTVNPLQASNQVGSESYYNAFISKLSPDGSSLVYSTYLGGSEFDQGESIAVDSSGSAYVAGTTEDSNFPAVNAFQSSPGYPGGETGFVCKLSPSGSSLVYASYLGGNNGDEADGVAVDASGSAYVTGYTFSYDFPTVNPLQAINHTGGGIVPGPTAFVTKVSPTGTSLVYSTYLGGSTEEMGDGIAVDASGSAYVAGITSSSDFPTTPGAFDPVEPYGSYFISKLSPDGQSLSYSTFLAGGGGSESLAIALDASGCVYVTGAANGRLPIVNPVPGAMNGNPNAPFFLVAFVSKLNASGSALLYSTFLGGSGTTLSGGGSIGDKGHAIAVDSYGSAYVTGQTASFNFPTVNPLQASNRTAGYTAFVSKISTPAATTTSLHRSANPVNPGQSVTFTATVASARGGTPTGTVTFSDGGNTLAAVPLNAGATSWTGSFSATGNHSILVSYSGDANYLSSLLRFTETVIRSTTISVSRTANPVDVGVTVGFTATVSSASSTVPIGTATFMDGTKALGSVSLNETGTASWSGSFLTPGNHTITVSFTGTGSFGSTTESFTEKVTLPTITSLHRAANPIGTGGSVTFTATVTSSAGGTPTGTVTFVDGTTTLAVEALNGSSVGTWTGSFSTVGIHRIAVTYSGDSTYATSTVSFSETVTLPPSSTSVHRTANPIAAGKSITFTAAVSSSSGGTPTGTVTFADGGKTLINGVVTLANGVASWTGSFATTGNHAITVTYSGDSNYLGSSEAFTETVD